MPKITQEQAEDLLYVAKELCSNRRDEPSGCEGCWLFDWDDETGEHPCRFRDLQDEIEGEK